MANVIKEKIRQILSQLNVSNDTIDNRSEDMDTDTESGSNVSPGIEEGDLVELKNLIKAAPSSDLTTVFEDQDMSPLFKLLTNNFLKTQDHNGAREVMDIFGSLLNGLPAIYVVKSLLPELVDGLSSTNELINETWLKTLERVINNQNAFEQLIGDPKVDILLHVIKLLSKDSVANSKISESLLVTISRKGFLDQVLTKTNTEQMNQLLATSSIVKTRILSLMVQIANIDDISMKKVAELGFLDIIIQDSFDANDPLLSLSCMQLLTELSSSSHGMDFISGQTGGNQSSPLDKATNMIVLSDFPLSDILLPGYLTLFASIASNRPSIITKYTSTVDKILSHFNGGIPPNTPIVSTCFDVIGSIGTSGEGKVALNNFPQMKNFLSSLGAVITGPSGDMKLSALRSLSLLLTIDSADLNGHAVTVILEEWYKGLSSSPGAITKALFSMAQEPFLDHRLGSLEVIRVLSLHQFGQKELAALVGGGVGEVVNSLPGGFTSFIEYLTTRSTEFSKEGKEAKFAIVSELIISPFTITTFGRENYMKLKQYFKEGPFFVSTQSQEPQVALQNN